jgi:hypothetical protein
MEDKIHWLELNHILWRYKAVDTLAKAASNQKPVPDGVFARDQYAPPSVLGNSGKPVTLETLSLTEFSKHVFQEQGIHGSRKPGTCEVSNSQMCKVRES